MSKLFTYNAEIYTTKNIADFLVSMGFELDYSNFKRDAPIEYYRKSEYVIYKIKNYDIRIEKAYLDSYAKDYYHSNIRLNYDFSEEANQFTKYNIEYLGKKNENMKEAYEKAKQEYDEYKKRHDKLYNMLKKKFGMPNGEFPRFTLEEQNENQNSGVISKIKKFFNFE